MYNINYDIFLKATKYFQIKICTEELEPNNAFTIDNRKQSRTFNG